VTRLARYALDHFLLLPLGVLIALVWANTGGESYFRFARALAFVVNDVGMAFAFAFLMQEVVEAMLPGGTLHPWRRAILPVVAAAGGTLGAISVYALYVSFADEPVLALGWPIVCAVDIAVGFVLARIIFRQHGAVTFLLLLIIASDAIGLVLVSQRYPVAEVHPAALALLVPAIGAAAFLRRSGVRTFAPYLLIGGTLSWLACYWGGVHPALALLPIVPFLPHAPRALNRVLDEASGPHESAAHFEYAVQREKKIAQLNDFNARFGAGTRASQVTSRRKEVERLQTTELARSNIQRPYIKFATRRPSGKVVLECEGLAKAHGKTTVISRFGAVVNRGDRIVLVGRNGTGKTTLLKALLADAPGMPASPGDVDAGTRRWGHEVSIGYFPQDHAGAIEKGLTAVEWLHRFDPEVSRQEIHGLLGQMLFSGEEGYKPTEALSGGETARLLFCRIMLQKPNVLVLDEPTNHLDLESINALNMALQRYEGTVFLVTHDQDLLEEVGTRVWQFEQGRIIDFKGSYEEHAGSVA